MLSKILVAAAMLIISVRGSKYHRCVTEQRRCLQYETHNCDSVLGVQPLESCCQPAMDSEGSGGYSNTMTNKSGIYTVKTGTFSKSQVYCDMDTDRGGWLTIIRRTQSADAIKFDKFEDDYMDGFGDLKGEFWLGLRTMHQLTKNGDCEMRVDLYDKNNANVAHIYYDLFKVDNFPDYKLQLGTSRLSNDSLTDSLIQFSGENFTVSKNKTDNRAETTCAQGRGGWWYKNKVCSQQGSVLTKPANELEWWVKDSDSEGNTKEQYNKYEMKIRPKRCLGA